MTISLCFFFSTLLSAALGLDVPTFITWQSFRQGTLVGHTFKLNLTGLKPTPNFTQRSLIGPGYAFAPSTPGLTRTVSIKALTNVTVKPLAIFPNRPFYIYASRWPVGVYLFNTVVTLKSTSGGAISKKKKLTVTKGGWNGIIVFPNGFKSVHWSGSPKNPTSRLAFTVAVTVLATTTTTPVPTTTIPVPPTPLPIIEAFGLNSTQIQELINQHNKARATLAFPQAKNMITLQWDPILAQNAFNYLNSASVIAACTAASGPSFTPDPNAGTNYWNLGGRNAGPDAADSYVGQNWYSGPPDYADADDQRELVGAVNEWTVGECYEWTDNGLGAGPVCTDKECSPFDYFYHQPDSLTGGAACSPSSVTTAGVFSQIMWADTAYVGCAFTSTCGTLCEYAPAGNFDLPDQNNIKPSDCWQS